MKIATWNINSVRLRIKVILDFIKKYDVDIICLQETKTEDKYFPLEDFKQLGLVYSNIRGEKSYNGVAILSRVHFKKKNNINWCRLNDSRHVSVVLPNNIVLHNFYVPSGGELPDININPKFKHKIKFLNEMATYLNNKEQRKIIVGDLNIAPFENDVWSHKQLLNIVSHTPIETKAFQKILKRGNLIDIIRKNHKENEKIYSWWSYRNKDWTKSNRGRRLDHVLVSQSLENKIQEQLICKKFRSIKQPSDHVPIMININI